MLQKSKTPGGSTNCPKSFATHGVDDYAEKDLAKLGRPTIMSPHFTLVMGIHIFWPLPNRGRVKVTC